MAHLRIKITRRFTKLRQGLSNKVRIQLFFWNKSQALYKNMRMQLANMTVLAKKGHRKQPSLKWFLRNLFNFKTSKTNVFYRKPSLNSSAKLKFETCTIVQWEISKGFNKTLFYIHIQTHSKAIKETFYVYLFSSCS